MYNDVRFTLNGKPMVYTGNPLRRLLDVLRENPYANPPPCEKLSGDMQGLYSRRINVQHRLVYAIDRETKTVRVLRMWSHYGDN